MILRLPLFGAPSGLGLMGDDDDCLRAGVVPGEICDGKIYESLLLLLLRLLRRRRDCRFVESEDLDLVSVGRVKDPDLDLDGVSKDLRALSACGGGAAD